MLANRAARCAARTRCSPRGQAKRAHPCDFHNVSCCSKLKTQKSPPVFQRRGRFLRLRLYHALGGKRRAGGLLAFRPAWAGKAGRADKRARSSLRQFGRRAAIIPTSPCGRSQRVGALIALPTFWTGVLQTGGRRLFLRQEWRAGAKGADGSSDEMRGRCVELKYPLQAKSKGGDSDGMRGWCVESRGTPVRKSGHARCSLRKAKRFPDAVKAMFARPPVALQYHAHARKLRHFAARGKSRPERA